MVRVTHEGKPLGGVTVEVRGYGQGNDGRAFFSAVTAANGAVHVMGTKPGNYWLNAELLGITAGLQCFHVAASASTKAKKRLTYEWGDLAPGVRQVAGRLVDSRPGKGGTSFWNLIHRTNVPIGAAKLKLRDALNGTVYSAESDASGHFSFGPLPNGTYVLHIPDGVEPGGRKYEAGDILFELSNTATWNTLLLSRRDAGGGSCGGWSLDVRNTQN